MMTEVVEDVNILPVIEGIWRLHLCTLNEPQQKRQENEDTEDTGQTTIKMVENQLNSELYLSSR